MNLFPFIENFLNTPIKRLIIVAGIQLISAYGQAKEVLESK